MASTTYIANRALTKLGEKRITSLDETSKAAETLSSMFSIVRDAELRANTWSFAKARTMLPALVAVPVFGFAHAFQLPADFIRLIQVGQFNIYPRTDTRGLFSIESHQILTDLGAPLALRYIKRVEDTNLFDPLFVEALSCRLAMEACEDLTQSATKAQAMAQMYGVALSAAMRANAVERPSQPIGDDSWMQAHGGGYDSLPRSIGWRDI